MICAIMLLLGYDNRALTEQRVETVRNLNFTSQIPGIMRYLPMKVAPGGRSGPR